MNLAHTIDETLARFDLISGKGDGTTTACAMSALSWAKGEAFTDRLPCANRVLNMNAIAANDAEGTTRDERAELVRAGEVGVLDTWWVPDVVVADFMRRGSDDERFYDRVLRTVRKVAEWKSNAAVRQRPNLRYADLRYADLGYADLRYADLGYADGNDNTILPSGFVITDGKVVRA